MSRPLKARVGEITDVASEYMSREHAEPLAANLVIGLDVLDGDGASNFERFSYVLSAIARNVECGLKMDDSSGAGRAFAASAIVRAWSAGSAL